MHTDNLARKLNQTSNYSYGIFGFFFAMTQDENVDQLMYLFGPKQHLSDTAQSDIINCTWNQYFLKTLHFHKSCCTVQR